MATQSHAIEPTETAEMRVTPAVLVLLALLAVVSIALTWLVEGMLPVVLAFGATVLLPRAGPLRGWSTRLALAVMAGLLALFVSRLWPAAATEAETVAESPHLLTWLVGLPLAGAIAILFLPRQAPRVLQTTTLLVMLATLAMSLPLLRATMGRAFHFNEDVVWMESLGIRYHVAVDGISLWLVLLTVFVTPIAAYASFGSIHTRIKDWCFALLMLEAAMIGSFVALDLFLFYIFWELMLIPMYVMIGVWGGTNRIKSALKFFLYTMFGSVLMLVAILYMAYAYGKLAGSPSFDFFDLQRLVLPFTTDGGPVVLGTQLPRGAQLWAFLAFTLAFFIKVPMWPVHTWLPDAHTEAPTAGSVILAAVMLKMGTYGYLRFCIGFFPEAHAFFAANFAGLAVVGGIIYGALCAWKQEDVKRLVAYSSVAHLGYVMLGLFAGTTASIEGSVLQMVNHGISTGALFLLVGVIYDRRHTRLASDFGGLARVMPLFTALFIVATMASIGLPGTNGFIGEFMIITGTFSSTKLGFVNGLQASGAAIGVILGALYMLSVVQKVFFGPVTRSENANLPDVNGRELVALAPLVAMVFIIGLFPQIFLSQIQDAAVRVQADLNARSVEMHPARRYYPGPAKLVSRRPEAPASPLQAANTTANP